MRRALTIAGSDSGGGAGIQADLKTFAAYGVYGASALTAITAQNTVAVSAVHVLPAALVRAQIDAVLGDIGADAVKTGMLGSVEVVRAVVDALRAHRPPAVVVDPVMIAKSGNTLLDTEAVAAVREWLLPCADVLTPNAPEAAALTGHEVHSLATAREAALRLLRARPEGGARQGRPPARRRGRRPALRRAPRPRAAERAHRQHAHARHRLHARLGDRRRAGPRRRARSRGDRRPRLRRRRHRPRPAPGPRPRPARPRLAHPGGRRAAL